MCIKLNLSLVIIVAGTFTASLLTAADEAVAANWKKHCTKCHDKDGSGDTKMGKKLKVRDYRDPAVQADMSDEQMMKAMTEGIKEEGKDKFAMKPVADKLSEEEMLSLVALIRTFAN